MKKVLFTAVVFSAFNFANAQEATSEFKPAAGANNLELNFIPLNGKPISITNIRFRRFTSATTAIRLGVGFSLATTKNDTARTSVVAPTTTINTTSKTSKFGWNIKPGIEKHFAGTNRLSPYVGAELDLAGQSSKEVNETIVGPTDTKVTTTSKNKKKGGFMRIGANALAGFDCYITKHLYLGTEFGFGLQFVKYSDLKVTTDPAPATATPDVAQGSEFNLGPNFNSAIRLGFIF